MKDHAPVASPNDDLDPLDASMTDANAMQAFRPPIHFYMTAYNFAKVDVGNIIMKTNF